MRRWQATRPQDANRGTLQTNGAHITITINLDLAPATPVGQPARGHRDDARGEYKGRRRQVRRREGAHGGYAQGDGRWRAQARDARGYGRRDDGVRGFAEPRHPRWGAQSHSERGEGYRSVAAGAMGARRYSRWNDHKAIRRWQGGRTRLESPIY